MISTKKQAAKIVGRLWRNSKMPCKSYSLPAGKDCHVGRTLLHTPGSTCHSCYAQKGFSAVFAKTVNPFRRKKLRALAHPQWVEAMTVMLRGEFYFRWHDSGDLQSVEHLQRIVEVCIATPHCKHWLPTREFNIVRRYVEAGGTFPENLVIRLSAYMVDSRPPQPVGLIQLQTSTVHHRAAPHGQECHAPKQGGQCLDCRACWSAKVPNVSYHFH